MIEMKRRAAIGAGITLAIAGTAVAEPPARNVSEMKFEPVAGLPTCARAAVQTGDPRSTEFIALAQVKSGCIIPWHWHTAGENLMIVSGVAELAMKDAKPVELQAGGFVSLPAKHLHQFRCKQTCTFFLYSDGKFDINYVDRAGKPLTPEEALERVNEKPATAMK